MTPFLLFLVLGLGPGAIATLLALGIVLEYRSSGVVNFAQGALAMFLAYVYTELRSSGSIVFPVLVIPDRIKISSQGLGLLPAIAITTLYGLAAGALIYLVIFRALRTAPPLSKVVASVGITIALQSLAVLKFGVNGRSTAAILPNSPITIAGALTVPRDRLFLAAIAVAAAAVLWAIYRFTRFGLATRAAAENEKGAILLGYSPDALAIVNWAIGTAIAGLAGTLIAPITALNPSLYTLFVVPALAAALLSRFSSFSIAALAGLLLGMAQSEITMLQSLLQSFPHGMADALPFVVIIVAMMLLGSSLPMRGSLSEGRPPRVGHPHHLLRVGIGVLVVFGAAMFIFQGGYRAALTQSLVAATACLSFVVLTGYVGQISMAQMAFAGVGGFTLSKLALNLGIPFPISMLLAALITAAFGLLVGLPALRIRGVNLAVVTLSAAAAIDAAVFLNDRFTGGFSGSVIPTLQLFGWNLDINGTGRTDYPTVTFGLFVLVVLVLLMGGVALLRQSTLGLRMLAVRANERAAAAAGINVAATKLTAFAISAFIAAIAGGLLGYEQHNLSADTFGTFISLNYLAIAVLGGISYITGSIVAGFIFANGGFMITVLDRWLHLGEYQLLIAGIGLILTATLNPDGIAKDMTSGFEKLLGRLSRRKPAPAAAYQSEATAP